MCWACRPSFGALYFVQGICEPTDGLLAQPINSLLKSWGQSAGEITAFVSLFWLPWAAKPLYGLVCDFVPLLGSHRKSYLIAAAMLTAVSLAVLYACDLEQESTIVMLALLVPATVGVAFSDVAVDALMVEKGQPRGLTGRFQAVQWTMLYGAAILAGWGGGFLSQNAQQQWGFLICAGLAAGSAALCAAVVSDPPASGPGRDFRGTFGLLRRAASAPLVLAVALFLFLWNFNPFSMAVLYLHATEELGFSEQFYGYMLALNSAGGMLGSLLYAFYCRRVAMRALVHLSIMAGIVTSAAYWAMSGPWSAGAISAVAGFATGTATVIQLDLAAQVCPPQIAATLFATLLGMSNLATALSVRAGGWCYERWLESLGGAAAFDLLVAIGALSTAACWLVVPLMKLPQSHHPLGEPGA